MSGTSNAPRLSPVGLQNSRLPAHKIFICRDVLQNPRSWGCSIAVSCKSTGNMASDKKKREKTRKKPKTERPQQVATALLPSLFSHELLMLPPSFLLLFWLLAIFNRYTHLIRGFSFTLSRFFSGPGPQGSHFGRQLLWLLWLLHGIPLL